MKDLIPLVRWIQRQRRTRSQCVNRWGHYFDAAIEEGLIEVGPSEGLERNGYLCTTQYVSLTEIGRRLIDA